MSEFFKTLFTGTIAGTIGGIVGCYSLKLIKAMCWKFKPMLPPYQFDDDGTNKGPRRIHHSFGIPVEDEDASNGKAWEHTSNRINSGYATCYGPYTKEISFRGRYKARFRIKAIGIKNYNNPIVILDITHGERNTNGNFVILGLPLREKELKGKDLLEGQYKEIDVPFEYDGQSLIEFRCAVTNPVNYTQNVDRIRFDNVKVFQVATMI